LNRLVEEDLGKVLGDAGVVSVMLDCPLRHRHLLKYGLRHWRTKTGLPEGEQPG